MKLDLGQPVRTQRHALRDYLGEDLWGNLRLNLRFDLRASLRISLWVSLRHDLWDRL